MRHALLMLVLAVMAAPVMGQTMGQKINDALGGTKAIDTMLVTIPVNVIQDDSFIVVVKIDSGSLNRRKWVLEQAPLFKGFTTTDDTVKAYAIIGDTIRTANLQIKGPVYRGNGTHVGIRLRSTPNDSTGYGVGNKSQVSGGIIY